MAFLSVDKAEERVRLIDDKDSTVYDEAVQDALKLQSDITEQFLEIMNKWIHGS